MRVLLTVQLPVERANETARKGKLGRTIGNILEQTRPEVAYFGEVDGRRTGFVVVNIEGPDKIPAACEPWFLAFDASVKITPVMTREDLGKAADDIERAAKLFGG